MAEKKLSPEERLLLAAELVDRHGLEMQPILDRAEREYDNVQQAKGKTESALDRVKRKLAERSAP